MKKVKFGIIGAGNIAKTFAKAVPLTNNSEIIAVASRTLEKSEQFAKDFNIQKAYGSYQDLLNDPEIDAIYVANVHSHHYETVKMCLESNKAVLCEKPFVLTEKDCKELIELAKEKNLLLMEAMWTRFLPSVTEAHKWIENGEIGDVKLIDASFCFKAFYNPNSRLFNKDVAGGASYDLGVYVIEFAMDFAGADLKDNSIMTNYAETGVDDFSIMNLRFKNDVLATLKCGLTTYTENDAHVYGSEGNILFKNFHRGNKIILRKNNGETKEFQAENVESYEGFKYEIEHFSNLYLNDEKESPRIPFKHNLETTKIFKKVAK
ncbi:MAG: Gfo/Idh/MocA family oxidoreductase [Clostridia bacterium]